MTIPLDPGRGGQSVNPDALRNADIIVSTTKALVSRAIRFAQTIQGLKTSHVSHAMLYIGNGQVVEAIGEGVVLRTLGEAIAEATLAVAYRHPEMSDMQALVARDFVGHQLDKPYNHGALLRQVGAKVPQLGMIGLSGFAGFKLGCKITGDVVCGQLADKVDPFKVRDEFFCSQLVIAAYRHAGIRLISQAPVWSTPQDIVDAKLNGHLVYVGHLKA